MESELLSGPPVQVSDIGAGKWREEASAVSAFAALVWWIKKEHQL